MWLIIFDLVIFLSAVWYLAWRKKINKLEANEFGLFVGAVWGFITLSPFLIYSSQNFQALMLGSVISIIQFTGLFFLSRWMFKRNNW